MSLMLACPGTQELRQLLTGRAPWQEIERLAEHLERCEQCMTTVQELQVDDVLTGVIRQHNPKVGQPEAEVVQDLVQRICELGQSPTYLAAAAADETPQPAESLARCGRDVQEVAHEALKLIRPAEGPGELGRLGAYRVLRVIGAGGMGVVFEAEHLRLKRVAAVKMILAGAGASAERLARFRRETEVIAQLQHPNIVPIYEVGEQDGWPYFVMEYVDGGSLAQKLNGSPLDARAAAELVETLARAVHHAHERGVVHRDLKPANILLQKDKGGRMKDEEHARSSSFIPHLSSLILPKITDFGLAKQLDQESATSGLGYETQSGDVLGTPGYMAPEQALGRVQDMGPAADIYALGAILYEALSGRPPFKAPTVLETLDQVRSEEPVSLRRLRPSLPRDLETICHKCLAKEPVRRFRSAQDLADDLHRFLAGEPIRARPVSWRERLAKWARRKPALATLVAVSGLAVAGLVFGSLVYERRLQGALAQAQANALDALEEKERADANYKQARATLTQMLGRVGARNRADLPRIRELLREQQEDAVAFFLNVARQEGSERPEVRHEIARACLEAGQLQMELGRRELGRENFKRALPIFTALAAEFPGEPRYRADWAACLNNLAACHDYDDEALRCHQQAWALRETLVRENPASAEHREALAGSHHNLGCVHFTRKRLTEAEQHWQQSIALRQELVRERPAARVHLVGLAQTQLNLSLMLQSQSLKQAEAKECHDQAEASFERLLRDDPNDFKTLTSLAMLRINWAYVLAKLAKVEEALADLGKNIKVLQAAHLQEPSHAGVRNALYRSHGTRALILDGASRYRQAIPDWERVVEMAPAEESKSWKLSLVLALLRAGEMERGERELEKTLVALEKSVDPDLLHRLARACSLAAGAAKTSFQREHWAVKSVELLSRAKSHAGKQTWHEIASGLQSHDDFKPLRGRGDLQRLLPGPTGGG